MQLCRLVFWQLEDFFSVAMVTISKTVLTANNKQNRNSQNRLQKEIKQKHI